MSTSAMGDPALSLAKMTPVRPSLIFTAAKKTAAKQKPSLQSAVQQPADQVQPQAPHQGNALTVDPTVDPDLLYNMRIGPYPGDFDFQQ
jgi:hypothetical protein